MLIKWALVCAILMEEDRIQDIYIYIYINAKQKKIRMLTKYAKQKKGKKKYNRL